jgi:hypothetical protein
MGEEMARLAGPGRTDEVARDGATVETCNKVPAARQKIAHAERRVIR